MIRIFFYKNYNYLCNINILYKFINKMIQYFQLTPDILLEYIYTNDSKITDNENGYHKDIYNNPTLLLKSDVFGSKYFCFKNNSNRFDSFSNLVLPLNNNETQFVVAESEFQNFFSKMNGSNIYSTKNGNMNIYEDTNYDKNIISAGKSCDVKYDKCIIHFTSRNYFGNYDALIFQAYAFMKNKSKIYFASFLFKRRTNVEYKPEHFLYNEKLYTTQIEFDIPSIFDIFTNYNKDFNNALKNQGVELLENTPIGINVYGVSVTSKGVDNYEKLKTLKINTVSIPHVYNRLDEISVKIYEAQDGDFYYIKPKMNENYSSFVDYIESMGEDIRSYMIMHELQLRETWSDQNNNNFSAITHKEFHIINIYDDDEDGVISEKFEEEIKYRPICTQNGMATIIDTIKIMNTVDSTTYEITGSLDIANPHKYGLKLKQIQFNESRPIINVYNKKNSNKRSTSIGGGSTIGGNAYDDNELNPTIVFNKGGGFTIENMSQNITSFIECTNIGVHIVELSPEDIN